MFILDTDFTDYTVAILFFSTVDMINNRVIREIRV